MKVALLQFQSGIYLNCRLHKWYSCNQFRFELRNNNKTEIKGFRWRLKWPTKKKKNKHCGCLACELIVGKEVERNSDSVSAIIVFCMKDSFVFTPHSFCLARGCGILTTRRLHALAVHLFCVCGRWSARMCVCMTACVYPKKGKIITYFVINIIC